MKLRRQNGITLVELLIAVTITAIITTLVYGSFARTFESREFVMQAQERYHTVRVALERMTREMSSAFVYDCRELDTLTGEHRHKTLFKVENEGKVDRMIFTSFSHLRLFRDAHESDQNVITYFGESDSEDSSKTNLMRREKTRIDGEPEEGGLAQILCPDIVEVHFELWEETKEDWVDEWDCSQIERLNRLPRMIKITLTVIDEYGQETPFTSIARVFTLKPLANFLKRSQ
ncbi:MAG: prepilin-type N-terminal cleavage/methylation domain-containing protein [Deltaproteobacteria bacterium]|nr:prepilin-type N-terminal cleavage/methylation domain-containing protein [Deltaproteobacteria bacterium]MBW1872226.1 prepilin-type N-terminal cleavage/methylation domain-containing protein [Deltaproteobacteria bacterium]